MARSGPPPAALHGAPRDGAVERFATVERSSEFGTERARKVARSHVILFFVDPCDHMFYPLW